MATRQDMSIAERIKDIKENPGAHQHSFSELLKCCLDDNAVDLRLMDAHLGVILCRHAEKCDVVSGPCACGGWH